VLGGSNVLLWRLDFTIRMAFDFQLKTSELCLKLNNWRCCLKAVLQYLPSQFGGNTGRRRAVDKKRQRKQRNKPGDGGRRRKRRRREDS